MEINEINLTESSIIYSIISKDIIEGSQSIIQYRESKSDV